MEGKLSALPETTREGYILTGWYTEAGEQVTADTVYSADTVLYARWEDALVVTITGTGSKRYCYVTIDGTKYWDNGTVYVRSGSEAVCYAESTDKGVSIYVGDSWWPVMSDSETSVSYTYTVNADTTISLKGTDASDGKQILIYDT